MSERIELPKLLSKIKWYFLDDPTESSINEINPDYFADPNSSAMITEKVLAIITNIENEIMETAEEDEADAIQILVDRSRELLLPELEGEPQFMLAAYLVAVEEVYLGQSHHETEDN